MSKLRAFEALARGGQAEDAAAAAAGGRPVPGARGMPPRERGRTAPAGSGAPKQGVVAAGGLNEVEGDGVGGSGPTVLAFGRRLPQKDTPGPLP